MPCSRLTGKVTLIFVPWSIAGSTRTSLANVSIK
jgi:hypothetical protein